MMNLKQALQRATALGLDRLDAQVLLLHVLGQAEAGRAWLVAHDTDELSATAQAAFFRLCQRRAQTEPLAYLTGWREFYGLRLQVDARVLDPRADTETLVDWALALLPAASGTAPAPGLHVVDLGTGSGCIALALRQQRPDLRVSAVDISAAALELARANGERLALPVQWLLGDWLTAVTEPVDLIVANPPYIAQADPHLAALRCEPLQALVSGADGLDALRRIITQASGPTACLRPGGWLLLEHGDRQAQAVRECLEQAGFVQVQSRCDLAGHERCSGGQLPASVVFAQVDQG